MKRIPLFEETAAVITLYLPDVTVISGITSMVSSFGHVYIVDNSPLVLQQNLHLGDVPNVTYLPMGKNTGLAHAMNIGCSTAFANGFKYVVTMDQDSTLLTDLMTVYSRYIEDQSLGQIGALCPQYQTDRSDLKLLEGEDIVKVTMQSGMCISSHVWAQVGQFSEPLFLDVIDWEYCFRLQKHGFKVIRCNAAVLGHRPATTKTISLFGHKYKYGIAEPVRYYYQIRNLLFVSHEYRSVWLAAVAVMKFLKVILLFPHKTVYFHYILDALRDAIKCRMGSYEDARNETHR